MDARRQRPKAPPLQAGLPVNPPGTLLGLENAVLTGTNNRYFVPEFEGCLSVKTVVRGSALWEAGGRRFKVHESGYLTLNDRQRYTLTIDSIQNATTFCLFFERGFVEDVFRATTMPVAGLLDATRLATLRTARREAGARRRSRDAVGAGPECAHREWPHNAQGMG